MDNTIIGQIESIHDKEELKEYGEVKEYPGLVVLNTTINKNSACFYFRIKDDTTGRIEIMEQLTRFGDKITSIVYKNELGYVFQVEDKDGNGDSYFEKYVFIPTKKELVKIGEDWLERTASETNSLAIHTISASGRTVIFNPFTNQVYPTAGNNPEEVVFNVEDHSTENYSIKSVKLKLPFCNHFFPTVFLEITKDKQQWSFYTLEELRDFYDSPETNPELKKAIAGFLPYFVDVFKLPDWVLGNKDCLNTLLDKGCSSNFNLKNNLSRRYASLDEETIPGTVIATDFNGHKDYYFCSGDDKYWFISGYYPESEFQSELLSQKGQKCYVFSTNNKDGRVVIARKERNVEIQEHKPRNNNLRVFDSIDQNHSLLIADDGTSYSFQNNGFQGRVKSFDIGDEVLQVFYRQGEPILAVIGVLCGLVTFISYLLYLIKEEEKRKKNDQGPKD